MPECDCSWPGWHGLHRRGCPRILAIALKWGNYRTYQAHVGRKRLPSPSEVGL